jgi:hypothetical protein
VVITLIVGRLRDSSNGEVEGPDTHGRGRTISQRPKRQTAYPSRPPPTTVRCQRSRVNPAGNLPAPAFEFDQKSMCLGTPYIFN